MSAVFGTWYPPDETPGIGEGILIAGFECGDREPVIADGFYDGENFKTHHYRGSTIMDEMIAWMPKPKFPVGFKHVHMTGHREAMHPYHCVLCGTRLHEIGLGMLECARCKTCFVPTCDGTELSVSWQHEDETPCP